MKKLNKGFMFYFGILFAVLVAAFLICVVIMVLSPGTSIFGLKYFKADDHEVYSKMEVYEQTPTEDGSVYTFKEEAFFTDSSYTINKIIITSNAHNVKIVKANPAFKEPNSFLIDVTNSTHGFSTEKDVESSKSIRYYTDTGILEIVAKVPEGFWVTGNSSSIQVQFPSSFEASNISLKINGGTGDVQIGDSKTNSNMNPNCITFKSAEIKANSVTVSDYGQIGTPTRFENCSFEIADGMFFDSAIFAANLTIKSTGGNVSLRESDLAIQAANVIIESKNATSSYGNITCTTLNLKNIYGSQSFGEVNGAVVVSADSRKCDYSFKKVNSLKVGEAATETEKEKSAEKCNFVIDTCPDVVFDIHTTGKVTIKKATNVNTTVTLEKVDEKNYANSLVITGAKYTLSFTETTENEQTFRTFKIVSSLGGEMTVSYAMDEEFKEFVGNLDGIEFKVTFLSFDSWKVSAVRKG